MRDPIRDLENFHPEGTPVNPLSASEVRRRGDRMRRRNNALATVGGVAAALAAVAIPLTVVDSDEPGRGIQPAPPATEWRQEVPEDFPLGAGFPERNANDGTPTQVTERPAYAERMLTVAPCGTEVAETLEEPAGDAVSDVAGLVYLGESEDAAGRTVVVYDDDAAAQAALDRLRDLVDQCPSERTGEDVTLVWEPVELDLATEESYGFTQQVRFDDGNVHGLTTTLAGRTGNALVLLQSYGAAGGDDVVAYETDRLRDRAAETLASMCVFAADPCTLEDPGPAPEPAAAAIPDDFPLSAGFPEEASGDAVRTGPSRELEPLVPEACGAQAPVPAHADLLRATFAGPSDDRERQLVTFPSEDEADAYANAVLAVFDDCLEVRTGSTTRLTFTIGKISGFGDGSGGAITRYEIDGEPVPGISTLVVARSGRAVLISLRETEEGGTDPGADSQEAFGRHIEADRPVVEAMQGL